MAEELQSMFKSDAPSHYQLFFPGHDFYKHWCNTVGFKPRPEDEFTDSHISHNGFDFYIHKELPR